MSAPPHPLAPGQSVLTRLLGLQQNVVRQRNPVAELEAAFELAGDDLLALEDEAARKLSDPMPPCADTTSSAYIEAIQNAEYDGIHLEILPIHSLC